LLSSKSDIETYGFSDIIFAINDPKDNIAMRSIISLQSNITRRKANITEAHFFAKCASMGDLFCAFWKIIL